MSVGRDISVPVNDKKVIGFTSLFIITKNSEFVTGRREIDIKNAVDF